MKNSPSSNWVSNHSVGSSTQSARLTSLISVDPTGDPLGDARVNVFAFAFAVFVVPFVELAFELATDAMKKKKPANPPPHTSISTARIASTQIHARDFFFGCIEYAGAIWTSARVGIPVPGGAGLVERGCSITTVGAASEAKVNTEPS